MNTKKYRFFLFVLAFVNTFLNVILYWAVSEPSKPVIGGFVLLMMALAYWGYLAEVKESSKEIERVINQSNLRSDMVLKTCLKGCRSNFSNMMCNFFLFQVLSMLFFDWLVWNFN